MKWVGIAVAIVLGLPVAFFGVVYAASEMGGEVVTLHRAAPDGSTSPVRIWIVDDGDVAWVEHGAPDAEWIQQASASGVVTLERDGASAVYRAAPDPASHARYHELRKAKYGWADGVVEVATGPASDCTGVPVRLESPQR